MDLARTEETVKEDAVSCFSISEADQASADAFQPMAEAEGKALVAEITEGIYLNGIQDNLFRLFTVLLDNAVKCCDSEGAIRFNSSLC